MAIMKKLIITSLLTSLFTTSAFAGLPSITFEGKKITVEDTRASLIKKLGNLLMAITPIAIGKNPIIQSVQAIANTV